MAISTLRRKKGRREGGGLRGECVGEKSLLARTAVDHPASAERLRGWDVGELRQKFATN